MILPTFDKEKELLETGYQFVVGIDEVGRGPWAGPVVACAYVMNLTSPLLDLVRDSKKLSEKQRESVYEDLLKNSVSYGIGESSNEVIDTQSLQQATELAMLNAYESATKDLQGKIYVLIDGYFKNKFLDIDLECVVSGDQKHYSIAAGSIVAKVYRDRLMDKYDEQYPEYAFGKHKGYGTKLHQEALGKYGISEIHRKSFKPVSKFLI